MCFKVEKKQYETRHVESVWSWRSNRRGANSRTSIERRCSKGQFYAFQSISMPRVVSQSEGGWTPNILILILVHIVSHERITSHSVISFLSTTVYRKNNVALQTKFCGICHSDALWLENVVDDKDKPDDEFAFPLPITLGHEISGEVYKIGKDVGKYE